MLLLHIYVMSFMVIPERLASDRAIHEPTHCARLALWLQSRASHACCPNVPGLQICNCITVHYAKHERRPTPNWECNPRNGPGHTLCLSYNQTHAVSIVTNNTKPLMPCTRTSSCFAAQVHNPAPPTARSHLHAQLQQPIHP